jgi:hypothetical protein
VFVWSKSVFRIRIIGGVESDTPISDAKDVLSSAFLGVY